jgi:hypothetical protein
LIITKEYGSWIFLGIIINNLDLSPDTKCPDYVEIAINVLKAAPLMQLLK